MTGKPEVTRLKITAESAIVFRAYEILEEEDGTPYLFMEATRARVEVDKDALVALEAIRATPTLKEALEVYRQRGKGDIDLVKLVVHLGRSGFLDSVDGRAVEKPDLTLDSKVTFFEWEVHREEGRDPMIGCPLTRRFVEADEETILAMKAIEATGSLREAEARLLEETGEDYDLFELVVFLVKRGFVRSIDGQELPPLVPPAKEKHQILHSVQPHQVAWIKHRYTLFAVAAIVASWIGVMLVDPAIRPGVKRFFWTDDPLLVLLTSFGLSILITYGHELAHFFMARAYGIESTVSISHRFYMVTLITDVTNAWKLSKGPRIKIFLAGVLYNLSFAGLLGIAAALVQWGILPLGQGAVSFLLFLQFLNFFPITFQFFLYARTDFYYVIATLLGERNLSAESLAFIRYRIVRAWRYVFGGTKRACVECPRRVLDDDPYCHSCGATQPVEDVNKYPFRHSSRHKLVAFGILMFFGRLWMYFNFFTIGWLMQLRFLRAGMEQLGTAMAARDWLMVFEAELLLLLVALQASFITYFFLGDIVKVAWAGLQWLVKRTGLRPSVNIGIAGAN